MEVDSEIECRDQRGVFCVIWGCCNRSSKDSGLRFHRFALKNKELLTKWLHAIRREGIHEFAGNTF